MSDSGSRLAQPKGCEPASAPEQLHSTQGTSCHRPIRTDVLPETRNSILKKKKKKEGGNRAVSMHSGLGIFKTKCFWPLLGKGFSAVFVCKSADYICYNGRNPNQKERK